MLLAIQSIIKFVVDTMRKIAEITIFVMTSCILSSCGFVSGQLHDKAMEEQLLKPGALDRAIVVPEKYPNYRYKFLEKYKISHDWYGGGCSYASKYNGVYFAVTDIFEQDGHAWQISSRPDKPFNIDRYVRAEWQSTNGYGKTITLKGFQPMCAEGWVGTSHGLTINLVKLDLDEAVKKYAETNVPLQKQRVGNNFWVTQIAPLIPRRINTISGPFMSWFLPVGDTGYTFVFELGANQDSLKYPEAHARMQEIFRHLIESVKIEPISTDAKP